MLLAENISLAIKSLISNKMRALLTMLGIIIGIAAVIAILTVGNSLTKTVSDTMQQVGANDVYIMVTERSDSEKVDESKKSSVDGVQYGILKKSSTMRDEDYITSDMISDMCDELGEDIYAVNITHSLGDASLSYNGKSASSSVRGASVGYFVTNEVEILAGSMFSVNDFSQEKNTALIPEAVAKELFGDDISEAPGKQIEFSTKTENAVITVLGVYEAKSAGNGMMTMTAMKNSIIMPLRSAMNIDRSKGQYSYFQVIAKEGSDPIELSEKIKEFYRPYYRNNERFRVAVITYDSLLDMLYQLLNTITTAISIIAAIALLVGGIGVMNIMLVSVTERTREIGTRKALGAKNSSIRAQFLVEAMIICLIGGIIGVIFGIAGGVFASHLMGYPASPSIPGIIIALLFSMSIGLIFGYLPANKAAKMNPIDALRYE